MVFGIPEKFAALEEADGSAADQVIVGDMVR